MPLSSEALKRNQIASKTLTISNWKPRDFDYLQEMRSNTPFYLTSILFTHGMNLVQTKVFCQVVFLAKCGNKGTKPVILPEPVQWRLSPNVIVVSIGCCTGVPRYRETYIMVGTWGKWHRGNVLSFKFLDARGASKVLLSVSCATDGAISEVLSPWVELVEVLGNSSIAASLGISFVDLLSASPTSFVLSYIVGKYRTGNDARGNDKSRLDALDISDRLNWVKNSMSYGGLKRWEI
jgi:hypothetical protein